MPPLWLVLCQDGDPEGAPLAHELAARAPAGTAVETVRAGDLAHGARWDHRVGTWGCRTRLRLRDGRCLDDERVGAVLNRLLWVGAEGWTGADDTDREYAGGELFALVQSWLEGLGARVVNRPVGLGLCGPWRTPDQWRSCARDAGLPIAPPPTPARDQTGAAGDQDRSVTGGGWGGRSLLVVDGTVLDGPALGGDGGGPVPPALLDDARRLAAGAGRDLMELSFDAGWRFTGASLLPALGGVAGTVPSSWTDQTAAALARRSRRRAA